MSLNTPTKIIGLTGGIACGKSTIAKMLKKRGFPVIDADELGYRVLEPNHPGFAEVVDVFGEGILDINGQISRPKLGNIVFQDPLKLEKLNQISHPHIASMILKESKKLLLKNPVGIVFLEAALLFEAGWDKNCWKVWIVTSERETVINRLCERNGFSKEKAIERIDIQMQSKDRLNYADYVLKNFGSIENLEIKVDQILKKYFLSKE